MVFFFVCFDSIVFARSFIFCQYWRNQVCMTALAYMRFPSLTSVFSGFVLIRTADDSIKIVKELFGCLKVMSRVDLGCITLVIVLALSAT